MMLLTCSPSWDFNLTLRALPQRPFHRILSSLGPGPCAFFPAALLHGLSVLYLACLGFGNSFSLLARLQPRLVGPPLVAAGPSSHGFSMVFALPSGLACSGITFLTLPLLF